MGRRNTPTTNTRNRYKPITIIFAVLAAVFLVAAVTFAGLYFTDKSELSSSDSAKVTDDTASTTGWKHNPDLDPGLSENIGKYCDESFDNSVLIGAYKAQSSRDDLDRSYANGCANVMSSQIAPYQTAGLDIVSSSGNSKSDFEYGFYAMFYRKGETGEWKWVLNAQQAPYCDDEGLSGDADAQKAFADMACYGYGHTEDSKTSVGEYYRL
jgi:hypothetical protein